MKEVTFRLSPQERDLILEVLSGISPSIIQKLHFCERWGKRLKIKLTEEEAWELIARLEPPPSHLPRTDRRQLGRFKMQLKALLSEDTTPGPHEPVPDSSVPFGSVSEFQAKRLDLSEPLPRGTSPYEFIQHHIDESSASTYEEMRGVVGQAIQDYNNFPQEDLGGLSPVQYNKLMLSDFESDESGIHLDSELSLPELEGSDYLVNARTLMSLLLEENGAKMTQAGNLNRAFVKRALERMRLPEGFWDSFQDRQKYINEQDVFELHLVRLFLFIARLIRKYKGKYIVSKRGKELLKPDMAGVLFKELLVSFLTRFNPEYLSRLQHVDITLQNEYPYALYRLHVNKGKWITSQPYYDLLPHYIFEQMQTVWNDPVLSIVLEGMVLSRIINPLKKFGFLEAEYTPHPMYPDMDTLNRIRTTPLFEKVFIFNLD